MTKAAAKSKAGYIVYFPGAPLRKAAHRSVCASKTVVPLRGRVFARKSSPPRKLTLKKKPTPTWSSTYYSVSLSVSDQDFCNQTSDSDSEYYSTGSSPSCCSSVGSNHPCLFFETPTASWSSNYSVSDCNQRSDSDSSTGSSSSSSFYSSGFSSDDSSSMFEQPTVYVLCKLVDGVLVRV